ncbi:hypothetical protein Hanom_Chr14g01273141 [Helianthus anomalus]
MHWKVMAAKETEKDFVPPKAEYQDDARFKALIARPSECLVIPGGALALFGMNLCRRDVHTYHAFKTTNEGKLGNCYVYILVGVPLQSVFFLQSVGSDLDHWINVFNG